MSWTDLLVALIGAGLLKYAADAVKWYATQRKRKTPEGRQTLNLATVDQSLAIVAKARDELEADNARLRSEIAEKDVRYIAERQRWDEREASYIAEIERLQAKVREIFDELENLKTRSRPGTNPGTLRAQRPL